MELLSFNVATAARRATLFGREYLVAPLSLIVPGVLPGSMGSLYYPPDETSKNPDDWNGVPLVKYHPTENGFNCSARSPSVLNRQGLGFVFTAATNDAGVLTAEGWFDVQNVTRLAPEILNKLVTGKPIELSTGLYTTNDPAPQGATYNGKPYTHVARDYKPDHVAVLPDQKGACSLADGCGVNVVPTNNKDTPPMMQCIKCQSTNQVGKLAVCADCGGKMEPTNNAGINQPRCGERGVYLPHGAGTGKGETYVEARKGYQGIHGEQPLVLNPPGENADFDSPEQQAAFFDKLRETGQYDKEAAGEVPAGKGVGDGKASGGKEASASKEKPDKVARYKEALKASQSADKASARATTKGTHLKAAMAHKLAAEKHKESGSKQGHEKHTKMAQFHRQKYYTPSQKGVKNSANKELSINQCTLCKSHERVLSLPVCNNCGSRVPT